MTILAEGLWYWHFPRIVTRWPLNLAKGLGALAPNANWAREFHKAKVPCYQSTKDKPPHGGFVGGGEGGLCGVRKGRKRVALRGPLAT